MDNSMQQVQEKSNYFKDRMQNILQSVSKFKIEFINQRDECNKLRELNSKLEIVVKEAKELETSYRYHLLSSREMIGNLQDTVAQLVYLKKEIKKIKEDILMKDASMLALEKDKLNCLQNCEQTITELRKSHEKEIDELTVVNERKIQQIQNDSDTQIVLYSCTVEELKAKLKEVEMKHTEKVNAVVLEHEEKIQRDASQIAQLQEQLAQQTARYNVDIDAYRRRLEEMEEKHKKTQFHQYLAQSAHTSQTEHVVERPYSANRNPYSDYSLNSSSAFGTNTQRTAFAHNKIHSKGALPVFFYEKSSPVTKPTEKKGQFIVTKKRKLYTDKDF